jgi:hypothetical protein
LLFTLFTVDKTPAQLDEVGPLLLIASLGLAAHFLYGG